MGLKTRIQTIIDLLSTNLPALLATAGLDDFDNYLNGPTNDYTKKQLSIYPSEGGNSTDQETEAYIIHCQLPKTLQGQGVGYHDVIFPYLEEFITAWLLGFENRMGLSWDLYPPEKNSGTSFNFYSIGFNRSLDDCDN